MVGGTGWGPAERERGRERESERGGERERGREREKEREAGWDRRRLGGDGTGAIP